MSRRTFVALLLVAGLALGGCATTPLCAPVTITVAAKEQRTRMHSELQGLRTTETGRVVEVYRDVFVREYWLKDAQGRWDQVSEAAWRAAEVGRPAEVCR